MRVSATLLGAAAILSTAEAAYRGFNCGAFFNNNQAKVQADFAYEFKKAQSLPGQTGWTSTRLYTTIQHGTAKDISQAIPAAISTNTKILLGMWASAGPTVMNNEIAALKAAIAKYGTKFTNLVIGISVGSEDLYRITPTGIKNKSGPGAQPAELVKYIKQVRAAIKGTALETKKTPFLHVDTWTAWVNGSNSAVVDNIDILGVDSYPYFQSTTANSIGNANASFYDSYKQTVAHAKGKKVWVTETGWPVIGPKSGQAVASAANARIYWEDVTCSLLNKNIDLFYYDLQEAQYGNPSPDFGIYGPGDLGTLKPRYSLTC